MYNTTKQCQVVLGRSSRTFAAFFVPENETTEYREIKSIRISAMSSSDGQITIGDTSSKSIQIMAIVDSMLLEGQKICVYESVRLDDGTYQDIPMGKYTIISLTERGGITTIEGAGPLRVEAYIPYFSQLAYPSDTVSMLNEISVMTGIPINVDNLIPIAFEKKPEGYICREMIGYIAAMYGKNAVEERDGSISLKWYEHQETDIFSDRTELPELRKSDFVVNKLQCNVSSDVSYTKGSGTGIIISNPFMTEAIMENVWKQVQGYSYRPAEINVKSGNPCIDQWDSYSYGIYNIICANIDHKYDGGVQNTITSSGESETEAGIGFKGPTSIVLERYAAELVLVNEALVNKLSADEADIKYIKSTELTTIEADIKNAVIGSLSTEFATVKYLETNYAQINFANVEKATIGTVLADVGLITEATIKDGHVTGYLDSVEINANSITAGDLSVERLIMRGNENSIVYALNNITGALQAQNVDTINGEVLTQRTVTADRLVAKSITANEIAASTISVNELNVSNIFGNEAVLNKLTTSSVFSNAVAANSVVVGASNNAINALNAVNGMEIGGRNILLNSALKDNNNKWNIHKSSSNMTDGQTTKYNKKCTFLKSSNLQTYVLIKQSILGKLEADTQYTLSGWVLTENIKKGTTNFAIMFYQDGYYDNNGNSTWFGYGNKSFSVNTGSGKWQYIIWTFTTDNKINTATKADIYVYARDFIGDVYFYDLKLEKGNKATDWSPAPEDISVDNIYKENTTLIDGGKIYTGTVTANAIAANAITAAKIAANAVTADKLNVSSLSAINANLGTVTAGTINMKNVNGKTAYITYMDTGGYYNNIGSYGMDLHGERTTTYIRPGYIDMQLNDSEAAIAMTRYATDYATDIAPGWGIFSHRLSVGGYNNTAYALSAESIIARSVITTSGADLDNINKRLINLTFYADTATTPTSTGSFQSVRTLPSGFTVNNTYIVAIMIQRSDTSAWQIIDGQISAYIEGSYLKVYVGNSFWAGRPMKILYARR